MNSTHQYPSKTSAQRRFALLSTKVADQVYIPIQSIEQRDSKRILLVSNNEQERVRQGLVLAEEGYHITTAISGTEAILLYHQKRFPLIVTDIALSDMGGIELLKALKAMDQDVLVIVTANYASLNDVLGALRADAYDYVEKPGDSPFQFLTTVRRAARRIGLLKQNKLLMEQLQRKTEALEQANAMLQKFAINDGLTRLSNRRHFQDCLSAEINRCERYSDFFALLFLDLDYFKIYNDVNGHLEGDVLLQSLAQLFAEAFRKTDTVARYGGDEFAVILPRTTRAQALHLGEKVCRQVAEYPFDGIACMPENKITISIGCAAYPNDGTTDDELLRLADTMLYKVKHRGGGQVA